MAFVSPWAGKVEVDTKETASNLEIEHCSLVCSNVLFQQKSMAGGSLRAGCEGGSWISAICHQLILGFEILREELFRHPFSMTLTYLKPFKNNFLLLIRDCSCLPCSLLPSCIVLLFVSSNGAAPLKSFL